MKYSIAKNVVPVTDMNLSAGQKASVEANGWTHVASLATGSRCESRIPQYFKNELSKSGWEWSKIGGTTNSHVVIGLKKADR